MVGKRSGGLRGIGGGGVVSVGVSGEMEWDEVERPGGV